jgi:molybdopterin-guanine dinucleotide biosynthesis protein A
MTPSIAISGLILAGGRGARMGSIDKGLQILRGTPMVQHAITRLQPQVAHLIINANQNLSRYQDFGHPVVMDSIPDYAGPLAGIQAGLQHCSTDYLVTVPCDSPFFPLDLVARLAQGLLQAEAEIAYVMTGSVDRPERHPVFALLKTTLLPDLTRFLDQDGHKMMAWFSSRKQVGLMFDDAAAFDNINTLEQLQDLER